MPADSTRPPALLESLESRTLFAAIIVNNSLDTGVGSLRAAIVLANATPGSTIDFNSGVSSPIILASNLPAITAAGTIIDGTTGTGGLVEIEGTGVTTAAFDLQAANITLQGLEIVKCNAGASTECAIELDTGSSACTIQGNYIGVLADGSSGVTYANNNGILITNGSSNNTIGGFGGTSVNIISNNNATTGTGVGLEITTGTTTGTTGNTVEGNYFGLDPTGVTADANKIGVLLSGVTGNQIEDNQIAGNVVGVETADPGGPNLEFGNTITANTIGQNVNNTALANGTGVLLANSAVATKGDDITENTISDNTNAGVEASGSNNDIATNSIDDNGAAGVLIDNTGERDTISQNTFLGNGVSAGASNGLAIDLGGNGVTANSPTGGTTATGANGLQPYPTLTVVSATSGTTVDLSIQSNPNTTYTVELYTDSISSISPTGYGQGPTYLGTAQITTNGAGFGSNSVEFANSLLGTSVTATATNASAYNASTNPDAGATSEFALNVATPDGTADNTITTTGALTLSIGNSVTLNAPHTTLNKTDAFFTDTTGDTGPYTVTVDYGDGTGLQPVPFNATTDKLTLIHKYPANLSYTYQATVTVYETDFSDKHVFDVTVVDKAPYNLTITQRKHNAPTTAAPYLATAQFLDADAGNGATFRVYVNYGDGTKTFRATTQHTAFGVGHQYTRPGSYKLTVTVIDDGGNQVVTTETIDVVAAKKKK